MCQCSQCNTTEEEVAHHYLQSAIENLISNQRQLDMDGCEVGVSREALETVLRHLTIPSPTLLADPTPF